jgi:16S rRNA (cytosine967-C5)-methyltransferase
VNLVRGDVRDPGFIDTLGTFDRILLDPPCSNLGVLRHNPEVKYRIRPGDPTAFATHQLQMLRTTARALRRGGRLIYSVCTVTPEETADVAHRFLDGKTVFASAPIEETEVCSACLVDADRFLMTFPPDEKDPLDGFFAARFVRL